MKKISFILVAFTFALALAPINAKASRVGEIIKVNSPPGTVELIEDNFSDETRNAIPYWDEDLPNRGELVH